MAHNWKSVKIWDTTRYLAKAIAIDKNISFAALVDTAIRNIQKREDGEPERNYQAFISSLQDEQVYVFYRQAQTHAAVHNLTVAEWMERAENAIKLLEQVTPNLTDETLAKAIMEIEK